MASTLQLSSDDLHPSSDGLQPTPTQNLQDQCSALPKSLDSALSPDSRALTANSEGLGSGPRQQFGLGNGMDGSLNTRSKDATNGAKGIATRVQSDRTRT